MGILRVRTLLSAPLPRAWDFIIDPRNMHHWLPLTDPVTGFDRPLQPGDRLTLWRRDFIRRHSEESLVEEIVPYRYFRVRPLWPRARRMDVTATLSVAEAADPGTTWIEEVISFSLGNGPVLRWVDRWLVNPVFEVLMGLKTRKAFCRLGKVLSQ
jgi:hypothetical protein